MRAVRTMGKARLMSDLLSEMISEMVGRTNCICFSGSILGFSAGSSFVGLASDKQTRKRWVRGCCSGFSLVADMVVLGLVLVQVQVCLRCK